jgi:hypothetical protein
MREQRKRNQNWMLLCLCVLMFCTSGAWADFRFGEPVNLGAPINTTLDEGIPSISSDGLSLYYSSGDPSDIWVAKRKSTKDAWEPGTSLGPIVNSSECDVWSFISADGLNLYFVSFNLDGTSNRPGGLGGGDIWQTTRPTVDDEWSPPANLGTPINSSSFDGAPCISANGLEFYFTSDRHSNVGDGDLYVCKRTSVQDAWSEPVALSVLNSNESYDIGPSLSTDGLVMFFTSWRASGYGRLDIYMTTRETLDASWSSPVNIDAPVNSSYDEFAPCISSDGRTLYFCGYIYSPPRPGGMGRVDIWQASIDPIVDFNGDELVDCNDVTIMIERWGTDDSVCDIGPMPWGDGVVDIEDLKVWIEYWEKENMLELTEDVE